MFAANYIVSQKTAVHETSFDNAESWPTGDRRIEAPLQIQFSKSVPEINAIIVQVRACTSKKPIQLTTCMSKCRLTQRKNMVNIIVCDSFYKVKPVLLERFSVTFFT